MSKLQQIWDQAHPVKAGQTLPEGTEYVTAIRAGAQILSISLSESGYAFVIDSDDAKEIRTIEPLPDPDDTGFAGFTLYSDGAVSIDSIVGVEPKALIALSDQQARNFARKLLEALDED